MDAHVRNAYTIPIMFAMSPITAIAFNPPFFLAKPRIEKTEPARPVIAHKILKNMTQAKDIVNIPNTNPAIAAPFDFFAGAGEVAAGLKGTGTA